MIFGTIHFPGKFGGLIKKDLRYFRRLLDSYIGIAITLATCSYLVFSARPEAGFVWAALIAVFLGNAAIGFNSFGLDSAAGFDRYLLFPVGNKTLLRTKNTAFVVAIAIQAIPIVGLAFWRLGFTNGSLTVIEAGLLTLAYLIYGNVMSVTQPAKMYFFRFSSGGSPISALGGAIFGSLPGLLMLRFLLEDSPFVVWQIAGMILVYSVLYVVSISWSANYFGRNRERIRLSIS